MNAEGSLNDTSISGMLSDMSRSDLFSDYCGRGKGMLKGWLYDWESVATMERQNPETRWVES